MINCGISKLINPECELNHEIFKTATTLGLIFIHNPRTTAYGTLLGMASVVTETLALKTLDCALGEWEGLDEVSEADALNTPVLVYSTTHLVPILEETACLVIRKVVAKILGWMLNQSGFSVPSFKIGKFTIEITPEKISALAVAVIFAALHTDKTPIEILVKIPSSLVYQIASSHDFRIPFIAHIMHNTICMMAIRGWFGK